MAQELAEAILSLVEGLKQPSPKKPFQGEAEAAPNAG